MVLGMYSYNGRRDVPATYVDSTKLADVHTVCIEHKLYKIETDKLVDIQEYCDKKNLESTEPSYMLNSKTIGEAVALRKKGEL